MKTNKYLVGLFLIVFSLQFSFSEELTNTKWMLTIEGLKEYVKTAKPIPETIEVLSYSHGISSYNENVEMSDLSVVTYFEAITPFCYRAIQDKKVFEKVILDMMRGDVNIRYELHNASITSVRPGGSSQSSYNEKPLQEISFQSEKIKVIYIDSTIETESDVEIKLSKR